MNTSTGGNAISEEVVNVKKYWLLSVFIFLANAKGEIQLNLGVTPRISELSSTALSLEGAIAVPRIEEIRCNSGQVLVNEFVSAQYRCKATNFDESMINILQTMPNGLYEVELYCKGVYECTLDEKTKCPVVEGTNRYVVKDRRLYTLLTSEEVIFLQQYPGARSTKCQEILRSQPSASTATLTAEIGCCVDVCNPQ